MTTIFKAPSLAVFQTDSGIQWSGEVDGISVKIAIPAPDGKSCVVLLDPDAIESKNYFYNLKQIDCDGKVLWTAKLPTSTDVFVSAYEKEDSIAAVSNSGFACLFDKSTGREISREFVK